MKTTTVIYLPQEVLIVENDRILSIPFIDIMTINCDKPYILVETTSKKYHLAQNLSGFCEGLPPFIMQCNKSTYINLLQVSVIQKNRCGYEVVIKGNIYTIARRRVVEIKENFLKIKTKIIEIGHCQNCMNCKITI
jgi:DNA-binding LytR/AlgR family response regulator